MDDQEWGTPELKRLYELTLDELVAQDAIRSLGLPQNEIENLAWGLTTQVAYGFDVIWNPKWLGPDDAGRVLPPLE
jgi:hypothetical protein